MTKILFKLAYKISKTLKERYPEVTNFNCEDAYYHISFYLTWGLFINILSLVISKYFLFMNLGLIVQIFYKELIIDGHLKRILNKTEANSQFLDFKSDLITRFIPFVLLGICILASLTK